MIDEIKETWEPYRNKSEKIGRWLNELDQPTDHDPILYIGVSSEYFATGEGMSINICAKATRSLSYFLLYAASKCHPYHMIGMDVYDFKNMPHDPTYEAVLSDHTKSTFKRIAEKIVTFEFSYQQYVNMG